MYECWSIQNANFPFKRQKKQYENTSDISKIVNKKGSVRMKNCAKKGRNNYKLFESTNPFSILDIEECFEDETHQENDIDEVKSTNLSLSKQKIFLNKTSFDFSPS